MIIDPRIDVVFKKLFGHQKHKHLLMSLINAIVSEQDQVQDITILNPYNERDHLKDKLSIMDIKAMGIHGQTYLIEMQLCDEAHYDKRALYYWSKAYSQQLSIGCHYGHLGKVIGIHILNFVSVANNDQYHNVFKLRNMHNDGIFCEDLELHTIELSKFEANLGPELQDIVEKAQTSLDRWVAFLTRARELGANGLAAQLDEVEIHQALDVLKQMSLTEAEENSYDSRMKWLWAVEGSLVKAKADGRQEERSRLQTLLQAKGFSAQDIAAVFS